MPVGFAGDTEAQCDVRKAKDLRIRLQMALCPNCFNHLAVSNTICLSCGAVIDNSRQTAADESRISDAYEEAAGSQTAVPVPSSLKSSLREKESEPKVSSIIRKEKTLA